MKKEDPIKNSSIEKVRRLFPYKTIVLVAPVTDHTQQLHDAEKEIVAKAVAARRYEFATGRMLAANALTLLGKMQQPILRGSNNEPIWPPAIVGSISHNTSTCVVAIGEMSEYRGIGVDLEDVDIDVSNIAKLVLRKEEIGELEKMDETQLHDFTRLTFSAKESIYKAVYPLLQRFIEFDEVRVDFSGDQRSFTATAPENEELDNLLTLGKGGYVFIEDILVTNFILPGH